MNSVNKALQRVQQFLHTTPILVSDSLNTKLGHNVYFKAESLQKTGAFKVRGALNHLLVLKENGILPSRVVAYSTGNHAIGASWVGNHLGVKVRIYMPENTSYAKRQRAESFGGEVIVTKTRSEAEERAYDDSHNGYYYLHPSDSDYTIAGVGTAALEAMRQVPANLDAIFASCGGGGLLSGTYLARNEFERIESTHNVESKPKTLVIGVEPLQANDAYLSRQNNAIYRFPESPITIADGLMTLGLSKRTFNYISKLDDFILVNEQDISDWTTLVTNELRVLCEASAGISMAAADKWLARQKDKKNILVIISGGNI